MKEADYSMPGSAAAVEKFFQLSLLGMVTSGFLAVAGSGYLDGSTTVLIAAGVVLRGAMAAGLLNLEISERTITVLTIAYIGFYPLDYQFVSRDFLQATVHLVFFVAILRILTAKANRDISTPPSSRFWSCSPPRCFRFN